MNMNKKLFLLRGIPGCGKSTLAKSLIDNHGCHFEADSFFMNEGVYQFDPTKIRSAHEWCQRITEDAMKWDKPNIVVSNTFTQEWEMKSYRELAEIYGYQVFSIIVENRHGGINEHGVPQETIQKMVDRFEIKLN